MDSIPDYCDRKTGKARVQYVDQKLEPVLSPILGPTYGVMVYQEQVMQIAREIMRLHVWRAGLAAPRDG